MLINNEESFITSAEWIWMLTSKRHSSVLINDQLSKIHNINVDERSVHSYHELSSLNHSENDVLLLLVWSSDCHDWTLQTLHVWAISEDDKRLYWRLIHDLCSEKTTAQIVLSLAVFMFLLQLLLYEFNKPCSVEANYLKDFLSLLNDFLCNNIQAIMKHMIWFVWTMISSLINFTEDQKIFWILVHVVDSVESVSKCDDKYLNIYWKCRFNFFCSNDEMLSIISEILKKLEITITLILSAKKETSTHIKFKTASDRFT